MLRSKKRWSNARAQQVPSSGGTRALPRNGRHRENPEPVAVRGPTSNIATFSAAACASNVAARAAWTRPSPDQSTQLSTTADDSRSGRIRWRIPHARRRFGPDGVVVRPRTGNPVAVAASDSRAKTGIPR